VAHNVQNFEIHAGDDLVIPVTVTDEAGQAVDLTGAAVGWQAARGTPQRFGTTPVVSKASGSGIAVTDPAGGVFEITLEAADTQGLRGAFYHEAEVTDAAGKKTTVMAGTMTVEPTLIA
jgi:hypothetical protein